MYCLGMESSCHCTDPMISLYPMESLDPATGDQSLSLRIKTGAHSNTQPEHLTSHFEACELAIEWPLAQVNPRPFAPFTQIHMQTTASAAAKCHLGPIKTQTQKAYVTADLSNEMIASNEITGSEKQIPVFILADRDRGPVQLKHTCH